MRQDERYAEALAAVMRARSLHPSQDQDRYLDAEEARLCYYLGLFDQGRDLGVRVSQGSNDVAAARALVAQSVNALALNQGSEALEAANGALLRLRVLRATSSELVDAQIQLTHVLAHTGRHIEAIANARSCAHLASEDAQDERARSEYALGFALAYAGSDEAIDRFLAAEGGTRRRAGALWNWIVFCLAAYLRDRGFLDGAADFLSRSSVALRHERAWFAYRSGDMTSAFTWLRALLDELTARGVSNWGFYDPDLTRQILRRSERALRGNELSAALLRRAEQASASRPPPELNVLLEALHLLNPESLRVLTDVGLTTSEVRTVLRALQMWLRMGEIRRSDLASALSVKESSVRAQFGRIRSKLGIHGRRGFEPILLWLAERDLLSPSTASIALRRLAAR